VSPAVHPSALDTAYCKDLSCSVNVMIVRSLSTNLIMYHFHANTRPNRTRHLFGYIDKEQICCVNTEVLLCYHQASAALVSLPGPEYLTHDYKARYGAYTVVRATSQAYGEWQN